MSGILGRVEMREIMESMNCMMRVVAWRLLVAGWVSTLSM